MEGITASTTIEELAAIVSATLESAGIRAVLSGGAVVSIYTHNEYESGDLDFVSPESTSKIADAMASLGFKRRGRMFSHPAWRSSTPGQSGKERARSSGSSSNSWRPGSAPTDDQWRRLRRDSPLRG